MATKPMTNRDIKLDILRILACFFVIMSHVSSNLIDVMSAASFDWKISHIYNTIGHTGTILFLFISGSLLLSEDYRFEAKKFYTNNFLKLLVAYILWVIIYHIVGFIQRGNWGWIYIKDVIINVIKGEAGYHFWYVPMILGIYLILPMLRAICKSGKNIIFYFVALFFVTEIVFGTIQFLEFPYKYLLVSLMDRIPLTLAETYAGYFVAGYFISWLLKEHKIAKPRLTGSILIIVGALIGLAGDMVVTAQSGANSVAFNSLFSLTLCMCAVGFFILNAGFEQKIAGIGDRGQKIILGISKLTFGIYMIHPLVITALNISGLIELLPRIIGVPCLSLLVFAASFLVVYLLKLVPIIRKWILYA